MFPAQVITKNLNRIIDVNYYPVEEARRSNFLHRPIGIGIQGLADAFILMRWVTPYAIATSYCCTLILPSVQANVFPLITFGKHILQRPFNSVLALVV